MGATNHTTNYNLSQFIGTDKPTWLTDYNGDMEKIDTALKGIDTTSTANSTNIQNMQQSISANTTNIAKNTTDITTLQANLGTVTGQYDQIHHEMGALEQKLTTGMSNLESNVNGQITELQTNVDGQIATINQRIDDLGNVEIPELGIIDTVAGIENNTTANKVTGALAAKGILSSVNAMAGQLQGFTPVINQTTGEMTGYKTTIGGADTVFPFNSGVKTGAYIYTTDDDMNGTVSNAVEYENNLYVSQNSSAIPLTPNSNITPEITVISRTLGDYNANRELTLKFNKTGTYYIKFNSFQGTSYNGEQTINANTNIQFKGWYDSHLTISYAF